VWPGFDTVLVASIPVNMKLPPLSLIENAVLKTKEGVEVAAKQLWESQPVFIFAIRRPGCVLCRDTAQQVWAAHEQLEEAGLKVVCVVHEWIDREINAFLPDYWGGEIYHDVDKAFYKVFGEGNVRTSGSWSLLNPLSPIWARIRAANKRVKDSNLNGESSILGGLLVVGKGQAGIKYMHAEKTFGEFPAIGEVVTEGKKAAAA